ncbi:glucose-6-phosphate isomerase family protein [Methanogenium cariaci]|uniref:glucose-6-phosphate isomerase family protein n=1 Tax=Methanogenium cariaci TaxID=2197 RepID=UPI000A59A8CF|nr:glucose-6-phosphate isomerase family protein [Methanogenium cariaci]
MELYRDIDLPEPQIRTIGQMRPVLAEAGCSASGPLYFMYRNLARSAGDREWLKANRIRFDYTVIPPMTLCGGEFAKTKGHYHPAAPDATGYPELYQVLSGRAEYLLQTRDASDVIVVRAGPGDVVLVPPGYGHVTINPADTELCMVNLVSEEFESEYATYESSRGGSVLPLHRRLEEKSPPVSGCG